MVNKSYLFVAVMTSAAVAVLSLIPGSSDDPDLFPHADKVIHFIMYAAVGGLWMEAIKNKASADQTGGFFLVVIIAAVSLYGLAIEVAQEIWAVGRRFEWGDAAANALGACAGTYYVFWFRYHK